VPCATIVAELIRETSRLAPIQIHIVNVEVTIAG
jgi:hypothetical protein